MGPSHARQMLDKIVLENPGDQAKQEFDRELPGVLEVLS